MSNFLSRLKSNQATSPGLISPTKSKSSAPLSPIESILKDNRPLRSDGSDKFFGMHNPSNTCYCNSVLQCLYYSEPFRKHVIEFPLQTVEPSEVQSAKPKLHLDVDSSDTVAGLTPLSPVRSPADNQNVSGSRTPLSPSATPTPSTSTSTTTNDNKDSFDNRKKQIMTIGPHIRMETSRSEQYGMPESLYTGLKDIFEAIIADKWRMGVVVPAKFMETLRHQYEVYRSPQHQDAHEFLNLLLNEVVEQVEKYSKSIATAEAEKNGKTEVAPNNPHSKANTSWVHELFEGTLTSETRCLTCETISRRDEVFLDLSVDLEEHTSVTACLKKFSQEEMLCERNKFHCDNCCGLQEAEKRMKIKRLPHILALHLKRFKYVEDSGRLQKLFHRVVFPFHLRLLNTTDDAEDADRLYELYAIIVHLGTTPFQGHYVSIIKTKDRGWLLFDDELVLPVDAQYIRNFFGGDSRNPACAYVLFYTKTTDEAMQREQNPEEDSEDEGTRYGVPTINEVGLMSPTESGVDEHVNSANGLTSPKLRALEDEEDLMTALPPPIKKVTSAKPRTPTSPARQPNANLTGINRTSLDGHNQARGVAPDSTQQADQEEKQEDRLASRHSAMRSGALSRFRNSSLSLKTKPRLWGKSDRADSRESEDAAAVSEAGPTLPNLERGQSEPEQHAIKSKPSRFGLGRKKSMNLLSRKE